MTTSNKLTKKELNQVFWRSFGLELSWNYERQMNTAFMYGMSHCIDRLYPEEDEIEKKKEAYPDYRKAGCSYEASFGILQYNSTIGNINLRY